MTVFGPTLLLVLIYRQILPGPKWFVSDHLLDQAMEDYDRLVNLSEEQIAELKNQVVWGGTAGF